MNDHPEGAPFVFDRVAYPVFVVPILAPSRLRASALLHGFRAPDPATASVLEIGCAEGINLTAFAAASPGATAVGFDLSSEAIGRGRGLVEACGLGNVELHVGDALTYPRDGQKFDYIICHGVLSWVPEPVRPAIIELIGARLAPGGLAYVSFDSLPGAASKGAIAPFLRRLVQDVQDPAEAMKRSAEGVALLNATQGRPSRLQGQLDVLMRDMPSFDPAYFFHDWLAEHYGPVDFKQLIPLARGNGLRIAGSAGNHDLMLDDLSDDVRHLVEAETDFGERLALLDLFLDTQMFHRDLFIRTDVPPEAAPDGISELSFAFNGTREEIDTEQGPAVRFWADARASLTTGTPATVVVLDGLLDAGGGELPYAEIQRRTGVNGEDLRKILLEVAAIGLVVAHATPQPFVLEPGERPRTGILARVLLSRGESALSLRGTSVDIPDRESELCLALCDGTRTRAEIAAAMAEELGTPIPLCGWMRLSGTSPATAPSRRDLDPLVGNDLALRAVLGSTITVWSPR